MDKIFQGKGIIKNDPKNTGEKYGVKGQGNNFF